MRRSGLAFRFLVLLTVCFFTGGALMGDVSYAQQSPLVLRGAQGRLAPTQDLSFLARNYTEIIVSTRGATEVMVNNRRGMLSMPDFASGRFDLQLVPWVGRPRSQQDGFFVNAAADIIAKRLLDSNGRVTGAFLMGHDESELLVDLNQDGLVELSILNSADGFMRASFTGEEGRAAFERILNGENPFCVSSPRSSTMAERARGDASACSPSGRSGSTGGPTGSGSAGGPPPDPMDIICAGYDPVRQRFSGISHGVDPDDPFPLTRETVEFLRDGFDGERDRGAAAARFVFLGWVVGLVAVAEVAQHEATGGLLLYVHAQHEAHEDEGSEDSGEGADDGEPTTPPDTTGGDTSRPGDGDGIGGPIAAACGSRTSPSQSEAFQSAFQQALNECPNPVETTAAAGEAAASCMNGSISRPRGPRGFMAITEQMLNEATAGCDGDGRCTGDRTGRLRQLRDLSSRYLGSRAVCDPATCQPPLE